MRAVAPLIATTVTPGSSTHVLPSKAIHPFTSAGVRSPLDALRTWPTPLAKSAAEEVSIQMPFEECRRKRVPETWTKTERPLIISPSGDTMYAPLHPFSAALPPNQLWLTRPLNATPVTMAACWHTRTGPSRR